MEIKTEVNKRIFSSENEEVKAGMLCEFTVDDKSLIGIYEGITKRGALKFQNTINTDVFYNVMPSSIGTLRIVGVVNDEVKCD